MSRRIGAQASPHDLRHTVATILGELGVEPDTMDAVQNHKTAAEHRCDGDLQRCPRLGLKGDVGLGAFAEFIEYTAEVLSFVPASIDPFFARAATVAELALGVAVIAGVWPRLVAYGSAARLALFGAAMAISLGLKSPLDYSVFSASAAALLLALRADAGNGGHDPGNASVTREEP